jgi:hypothetical protein
MDSWFLSETTSRPVRFSTEAAYVRQFFENLNIQVRRDNSAKESVKI